MTQRKPPARWARVRHRYTFNPPIMHELRRDGEKLATVQRGRGEKESWFWYANVEGHPPENTATRPAPDLATAKRQAMEWLRKVGAL